MAPPLITTRSPPKAGADKADLLGGALVQAGHDQADRDQGGKDDPRIDGRLDHGILSHF
jgi:hypothetical protein